MIISNTTREAIENALQLTSDEFDGNVVFHSLEAKNAKGTRFAVRLKVKESSGPGAKCSAHMTRKDGEYRRSSWACWHVHGTFHDFLNPDAVIHQSHMTQVAGKWFKAKNKNPGDDWSDWEVGSLFDPRMASDCCDC